MLSIVKLTKYFHSISGSDTKLTTGDQSGVSIGFSATANVAYTSIVLAHWNIVDGFVAEGVEESQEEGTYH